MYVGLTSMEILKLAVADNDVNTKVFHHESPVLINVARKCIIGTDPGSYARARPDQDLPHLTTSERSTTAKNDFLTCFASLKKPNESVSGFF